MASFDSVTRCIANPAAFSTTYSGCIAQPGSNSHRNLSGTIAQEPSIEVLLREAEAEQQKIDMRAQQIYERKILPKIDRVAEELKKTGSKSPLFRELEQLHISDPSASRLQGVVRRNNEVYPDMSLLTFNALDKKKDGILSREELGETIFSKLTRRDGSGGVRSDVPGMLAQKDLQQHNGITPRTWGVLLNDINRF